MSGAKGTQATGADTEAAPERPGDQLPPRDAAHAIPEEAQAPLDDQDLTSVAGAGGNFRPKFKIDSGD